MKRLLSSVAIAAMIVGSIGMYGLTTATAQAATASTVVVTPSTALANGQTVVVTGSGFTAGDSVYALECLATATTSAGCDTATLAGPLTVSATGTLPSTTFKVVTGVISGTATCGTSATDLGGCSIDVANASNGDAGTAPITFAAATTTTTTTAPTVPPFSNGNKYLTVSVDQVTGGGSAAGSTYAGSCAPESLYGQGATVVFRMWGTDNENAMPLTESPAAVSNVQSVVIEDLPGVNTPPAMNYSNTDGYFTYGWKTTATTPVGAVPFKVVVTLDPVNPVYKKVIKNVVKNVLKNVLVTVNGVRKHERKLVRETVRETVKVLVSSSLPAETFTYTESGLPSPLTIAAKA